MTPDRLIRLRYWAGARAAAGVEQEEIEAPTVAAALAVAASRPGRPELALVLRRCSFLRDGVVLTSQDVDAELAMETEIEVLPPFAGGSRSWLAQCVQIADFRPTM